MHEQFMDEFQQYLTDWKESVDQQPGYSKEEKSFMLLSRETRHGLRMNCKGIYLWCKF